MSTANAEQRIRLIIINNKKPSSLNNCFGNGAERISRNNKINEYSECGTTNKAHYWKLQAQPVQTTLIRCSPFAVLRIVINKLVSGNRTSFPKQQINAVRQRDKRSSHHAVFPSAVPSFT